MAERTLNSVAKNFTDKITDPDFPIENRYYNDIEPIQTFPFILLDGEKVEISLNAKNDKNIKTFIYNFVIADKVGSAGLDDKHDEMEAKAFSILEDVSVSCAIGELEPFASKMRQYDIAGYSGILKIQ